MSDAKPEDEVTLGAAKAWLLERQEEGVRCPCCNQMSKVYKRNITAATAALLIRLYRDYGQNWFHRPTEGSRLGGDASKPKFWGLIQEENMLRDDGGRAGWWRLTDLGVEFVKADRKIRRYAHIYDNDLVDMSGEFVGIGELLGERFSYEELMNR